MDEQICRNVFVVLELKDKSLKGKLLHAMQNRKTLSSQHPGY